MSVIGTYVGCNINDFNVSVFWRDCLEQHTIPAGPHSALILPRSADDSTPGPDVRFSSLCPNCRGLA
jgi:hypothetical protein